MLAMAPAGRVFKTIEDARAGGCREACALVLLYPHQGATHTVLTLRHAGLRDHAGQVSLPGGRIEPGEDAVAGAFREAHEELAIEPETLDFLGMLTPLHIPPTDFCLYPVLAAARHRPAFIQQPEEVAELIEWPVHRLTDDAWRGGELRALRGEERWIPYFRCGGHKVWGATAMILAEVAALWREACVHLEGPTGTEGLI